MRLVDAGGFLISGGEGEIRTPVTRKGKPAFEAGAIDHSATSPRSRWRFQYIAFISRKDAKYRKARKEAKKKFLVFLAFLAVLCVFARNSFSGGSFF
jgi:hypothetical protein